MTNQSGETWRCNSGSHVGALKVVLGVQNVEAVVVGVYHVMDLVVD